MTTPRRKPNKPKPPQSAPEPGDSNPTPTGMVFLGEEDKRLLKKFNKHIVQKLGLKKTRSVIL